MTRWGLVIGSQFDDPRGVENDTRLIGDLLAGRGFSVETLLGPDATRARILASWDGIIAGAGPDDAVAIYYAGHGALVINTARQAERHGLPHTFRAICPTDYAASSDDDFRGISSFELSIKLAALTAKTRNVTVILDCCYSGQLCRGAGAAGRRARGLPYASRLALARHLQDLRDSGALDGLGTRANPDAVRIVGAGESSGAFPTRLPATPRWLDRVGDTGRDGFVGALTLALVDVLDEVGDTAVPWDSLLPALRARVRAHGDGQQPDIEGPVKRAPFQLAELDASYVPIESVGAGFVLGAGRIAGVSVGDVYEVRSALVDPAALARARIEAVTSLTASGSRLEWLAASHELPLGAVAVASELAFERRAVRVTAGEPDRSRIEAAVEATGRLRVAAAGEREVLADVELHGDRLIVRDGDGPLFDPAPYPVALGNAASDLASLAMVQRLRALATEHGVASSEVEVVWGTVDGGVEHARPEHGFALGLNDVIYLRVINHSSRTLHAHVFNIGLRGRIALLSSFELPARGERTLGSDIDERLRGIPLAWPLGMSRSAPGIDTLLTIVTTTPTDLRMLESTEQLAATRGGGELSRHLLGQPSGGATRGGRREIEPFAMVWRDYWLFPIQARLAMPEFEIDEKPFGVRSSPADAPDARDAVRDLRVRLGDLEAAPADLRIDGLVCTRAPQGATPYCAHTFRLTGARDDTGRLLIDDGTLWTGPARDFADVYLWISSGGSAASDLAELLRTSAASSRLRDAMAALCATGARAASLASAASTALASLASELLGNAIGATGLRGLYRGAFSLLAAPGATPLATTARYCAAPLAFSVDIAASPALAHRGVGSPATSIRTSKAR